MEVGALQHLLERLGPAVGAWLLLFGMNVLRLAPTVLVVSGIGGREVVPSVRTPLLLVIAATTTPLGVASVPTGPDAFVTGASQLVVGIAAALPLLLIIEALRGAGGLVDWAAGRGAVTGQESSASFATVYGLGVVAAWSAVGGPAAAVRGHATSLDQFALTDQLSSADVATMASDAISATGAAFALTVAIGLPVLGAALMVDIAMGWLGRSLPSLQTSFASMSLKLLVALSVVAAGLGAAVVTGVDALLAAGAR